jgi:hypothetical protein
MAVQDGDLLRISVSEYSGLQTLHMNVHHALCDFDEPQTEAAVLDACAEWMDNAYAQLESWKFAATVPSEMRVDVIEWNSSEQKWEITNNVGVKDWAVAYTPEDLTDPLPFGVGVLAKFRTPVNKSVGKKFIGNLTELGMQANNAVAGLVTDLADYASWFVDAYNVVSGSSMIPGLASTKLGQFLPFIEAIAEGAACYQRRRAPGRGA